MSAPNTPKPITAIRFGYPFQNKQSKEITDPQEFYEGLANVQGGHYLLSPHGFFHGGIHIARASSNAFQLDEGIRCLADGEVIAYRINRRYDDATPGTAGDGPALRPYSTGFVLVRHRMQAPSPPQPPKPAPMDHPGADIRNWGTWLCEDPHGRKHLAWLRHGTPLSVEIGATGPGDSGYVRVLTTSGLGVPDQGWIKRTCLAIDPLAGTSIRNMMGLKDVVATQVYRGDTINPDAVAAHAQNKAEQELPAIAPAPTLTLYSLYMHVADFESHQKHTNWKRPPWWPVTGYRVGKKAKDRSKSRTPPAVGLNIREAPGRSPILALLLRDSVIDVGERSPDGKWARIARIVEGGIESVHADGAVPPEARHGWVFLGELDAEAVPEAFDSVVALKKPHPIKLGDVIGYLGEDVPARAYPIAEQPVSRKLLHLEVFSGDDVPVYLPASRQWAKQHLEDKDRTLLLLRPGDTLLDVPNGNIAYTLNWAQVLSLTGLEVKEVDGQRWRKVAKPEFAGWIKEAGHIASSWEWPGFDVVDEQSSQSGAAWRDLAEKVGFIKKEGPHPDETPLYKALRKLLDTDGDGKLSEQELDAVLRNRSKAAHIGRLIVRHDSEWSQESATLQQQMARSIAEMLGFNALKQVEDEMPRAQKLPWWDDVVSGVEGFPASSRVYHFHPGGVAGNFTKNASNLDELVRKIGDIISHGEGGYESYNTGTSGVPNGRVGHSFIRPPAGTVTGKKINEILSTEPLPGTNSDRMFATGKYQTIFPTLRSAVRAMGLTGEEYYDADMQERVFREFLIYKAGTREVTRGLAKFVIEGKGTVENAQYAASQEWASIATPSGCEIRNGRVSDGTLSYYESAANHANKKSTASLRAILEEIDMGAR